MTVHCKYKPVQSVDFKIKINLIIKNYYTGSILVDNTLPNTNIALVFLLVRVN